MALQKREKTMLMVLGVVVVVFVLYMVLSGGKSKQATSVQAIVQKTAGQLGVESAVSRKPASALKYADREDSLLFNTWGKRDPFSKPQVVLQAEAAAATSPVVVKGIIWMKGKPYVLINDVILTAGEEKKGIRIDKIEGNKVFCRRGGNSYTLQWSKSP
jgi:hypothetical protein